MVDLSVNLAGMQMDNPVVPASGTFGFGKEFKDIYDINILGSFSFKGTTKDARFGNPTPRIAECTSGMINAVGLQNPGVHHVIEHELPEMKEYFHKPVIANVSGFSVEDYAYTCSLLDKEEQVGILEVNVSCPNVHGGGMSFGTSPECAAQVAVRMVYQVAKACNIPVMGCGGVSSAKNVIEMMMAGATAVQVGAANLVNPYVCKNIIESLEQECEKLKIDKISDIIGVVD